MKFALVNGEKVEATNGAKGLCSYCGSELIAKCGEIKINHWAHKGKRHCDPWWENETEWHRLWKNKFPKDWQEIRHKTEDGEIHIADVKTANGWIIEFQHSFLKPEERQKRNAFYRKLVWIVDGTRRKTDAQQFDKAIQESIVMCEKPLILWVLFPEEYKLLKEWDSDNSLILFDFQDPNTTKQYELWFLYPKYNNDTYISPFPRNFIIELLNKGKFDELVKNVILSNLKDLKKNRLMLLKKSLYRHPNKLHLFERYLKNKHH